MNINISILSNIAISCSLAFPTLLSISYPQLDIPYDLRDDLAYKASALIEKHSDNPKQLFLENIADITDRHAVSLDKASIIDAADAHAAHKGDQEEH